MNYANFTEEQSGIVKSGKKASGRLYVHNRKSRSDYDFTYERTSTQLDRTRQAEITLLTALEKLHDLHASPPLFLSSVVTFRLSAGLPTLWPGKRLLFSNRFTTFPWRFETKENAATWIARFQPFFRTFWAIIERTKMGNASTSRMEKRAFHVARRYCARVFVANAFVCRTMLYGKQRTLSCTATFGKEIRPYRVTVRKVAG